MITGKDESRTLAKHISCKCEGQFDGKKCNSNQKSNNCKCIWDDKNLKKLRVCEKSHFGNLEHVAAKMVNMQKVLSVIQ